jgi:cystathionine beta-lyase family protein involved in aluminum resistance
MEEYLSRFGISRAAFDLVSRAERGLRGAFEKADETAEKNQLKVIAAMRDCRLQEAHFSASSGYGYSDAGRDALEAVYAGVFGTEAALVRPQIASGTAALSLVLSALLNKGDSLVSLAGPPYDTLSGVIGIRETRGSLISRGIAYSEVPLNGLKPDLAAIKKAAKKKPRLALIQRSKGYRWRESLTVSETEAAVRVVKAESPDTICLVDNCYCEFVSENEPQADIVAGSLIKNPGGGLAPCGGYAAGKTGVIEDVAARLTAPGLGREVGASLGFTKPFAQGLFFAPAVTASALKGARLAAKIFEDLGFPVLPAPFGERADIVQAIRLGGAEKISAFCAGVQAAAPVDSFAVPEPWDMPGYDCPVIMAAGAFNQGASIELSADAPMRPPYDVFLQGGLTYPHAKLGAAMAAEMVMRVLKAG